MWSALIIGVMSSAAKAQEDGLKIKVARTEFEFGVWRDPGNDGSCFGAECKGWKLEDRDLAAVGASPRSRTALKQRCSVVLKRKS